MRRLVQLLIRLALVAAILVQGAVHLEILQPFLWYSTSNPFPGGVATTTVDVPIGPPPPIASAAPVEVAYHVHDLPDIEGARDALDSALDTWTTAAGVIFVETEDQPSIVFTSVAPSWDLDGSPDLTYVGSAWGRLHQGSIVTFNELWTFATDEAPDGIDFESVAVHEIAHALGAEHRDDGLTMTPETSHGEITRTPSWNEIAEVRSWLYGTTTPNGVLALADADPHFACTGTVAPIATVLSAEPDEQLVVTVPEVGFDTIVYADHEGRYTLSWSCEPGSDAIRTFVVEGVGSGRTVLAGFRLTVADGR